MPRVFGTSRWPAVSYHHLAVTSAGPRVFGTTGCVLSWLFTRTISCTRAHCRQPIQAFLAIRDLDRDEQANSRSPAVRPPGLLWSAIPAVCRCRCVPVSSIHRPDLFHTEIDRLSCYRWTVWSRCRYVPLLRRQRRVLFVQWLLWHHPGPLWRRLSTRLWILPERGRRIDREQQQQWQTNALEVVVV